MATPPNPARLAGEAKTGEIVFSDATGRMAGLNLDAFESRVLKLKSKEEPFKAWIYQSTSG